MLPFDRYRGNGRKLLGPLKIRGASRHGYGPSVFDQCGAFCAYCDRSLNNSYESWLDISIDHVIPKSKNRTPWYSECKDWIEDLANIVTCCRACNEFLNGHKVDELPPNDVSEFFNLRDKVFIEKRNHARKRHQDERARYERWNAAERLRREKIRLAEELLAECNDIKDDSQGEFDAAADIRKMRENRTGQICRSDA